MREDDVLLALVEAVDLIYEEDGALLLQAEAVAGLSDDAAEVGDAGSDGGDGLEMGAGEGGDDAGEGGLAGAGGAPEDDGGELISLYGPAEDVAGADELLLADELVEGAGAHAGGQRGLAVGTALGRLGEHVGVSGPLRGGHGADIIAGLFEGG